ncbi:DNA glycosylase AlkZ-like family protein [Microlunatus sp. GCM10028923]|uniref:DNA glycosylase AlkZ-like family protein n=1 Tax=Microlunatus sp. GCM10028923 TaxID=3273400 RepID=UPI0036239E08
MRLDRDQLAELTLRRQFPSAPAGRPALRDLRTVFRRIGPVQSQAPRAPFLAAASRLPGLDYHTICAALESYQLVKTSNLRGTVHTSVADRFALLDAVARLGRSTAILRQLGLQRVDPAELEAELEAFCTDAWRSRDEICEHADQWLAAHEPGFGTLGSSSNRGLIWGHSGLIRRPKDAAWEKRTDIYHRTAAAVIEEAEPVDPEAALAELITGHCAAYGPVHRRDLAFFFGVGLTRVDTAVAALGDTLVQHTGPDHEPLFDLARPPRGGESDPGCRLLGEFDGLLLGFSGPNRTRFCTEEQLAAIWRKANGLFAPVVLHDQRLVATWRTVARGRRTEIEITPLPGESRLSEDIVAPPAQDVATALNLDLADLRLLP